ncbi:MAG: amidohydrolase family protein [Sphingomonadales bacterium]|nr:amidohydrolase family protein [Sphingomonadales bacterium]
MSRLILKDANVLDGDNPGRRATVVVEGERIAAVATGPVEARPGDRVVDCTGKTVMPGMVQAHFHAAYWNTGNSGRPLGLEVHPSHAALRAAANFRTALDCGFTACIGAASPHGIDAAMKLAIAEGALVGPRIMAGSRDVSTTGHSSDSSYPDWMKITADGGVHIADGPDAIRRVIREEAKAGAEIIKLFVTRGHGTGGTGAQWEMQPDELEMAVRIATERGIKTRAHVSNRDAVLACIETGVHIIDHGDGFDERCIERILAKGAFLTPSLWFPTQMMRIAAGTAYAESMKPEFEGTAKILPIANQAGVKLLIGDDYGAAGVPHGTYAEEMILYVETIGIPALDVIRWATKHGAEAMGLGDQCGTIAPGKLADLLVVNGDPSADITLLRDRANLAAILLGGKAIKDTLS